jgi:hypothetical protein
MKAHKLVIGSILTLGILVGGSTVAQAPPPVTVNPAVHPNIAAAQKLIAEAYSYIIAAQKANDYDMQGHAANAENLLTQASKELNLSAQAANQRK